MTSTSKVPGPGPAHLKSDATPSVRPMPFEITITFRTFAWAALVVGMAWVVIRLAPIVLLIVVALFLVGTLGPIVESLETRKLRRASAIGVVFGSILVAVAGVAVITVPVVISQVIAFVGYEPQLRARAADMLSASRLTVPLADALRGLDYSMLARSSAGAAIDASTQSVKLVAYSVSAVFLALYIMLDRDRLRGALYALVPRTHHVRMSRVILNLEVIVGGYIRGQMLTSVMMAAFTFAVLAACRVKGALAIAMVTGIADVLPYVGVFISVGLVIAASASHGPGVVALVLLAMLVYGQFENRFLVPRVYGRVLKLPSSAVLIALLIGGELMGIAGALLALPVAAAVRMLVEELRIELPGEDIDDTKIREGDARAEHAYERRAQGVPAEDAAAIAVSIAEHLGDLAGADSISGVTRMRESTSTGETTVRSVAAAPVSKGIPS